MARKASYVSAQRGVSRPVIVRKKNTTFANNCTTLSNNYKGGKVTANKRFKKKGRQKMLLPVIKWKNSSKNCDATNNGGDSFPSKGSRKRKRRSVAKNRIESTVSRDFNCSADNIEIIIPKNNSLRESDDRTLKNEIQKTSKAGQVSHESVQSSLWTTTMTNDFPKSWTTNMIRYYFEPNDENRNFDYVKIMDNIEYKASDWVINDADRTERRKSKEFFLRCAKCNQRGHTKKDCKKIIVCYVCGEFNHWYPNCPNALCLTCGRTAKKYSTNCYRCRKALNSRRKCNLCEQVWHEESLCPSKWRKHLMVAQSSCESTFRLNSKKCCYNCAQWGHFGFECPLVLQSDYPPENPLKTAFPLEQRYPVDDNNYNNNLCSNNGNDGRDYKNPIDTGDVNGNLSFPHVHVIFLTEQTSNVLSSDMGRLFLADLSHGTNIRIEFFRGKRSYVKLFGGDDGIVNHCKNEIFKWKAV